jgi:hypothetical protein
MILTKLAAYQHSWYAYRLVVASERPFFSMSTGQGKLTYGPTTKPISNGMARRLSYCPSFFLAAAGVVQNASVDANIK